MRLLVELEPLASVKYDVVNKHAVQGMIYNMLRGTQFDVLHLSQRFKYFTFSDIFPVSDFIPGTSKNLIISSPNRQLIETLYSALLECKTIKIKEAPFIIKHVKMFSLKYANRFICGSPIVLYKDNRSNEYFSFEKHQDLKFFLDRLKANAIKKYSAYTGSPFELDEQIFDKIVFKKEVAVKDFKSGKEFIIIGSVWKLLEKFYIPRHLIPFYEFIMDCGLGEKNSLGFGLINPVR
jgi:CRISPR-associated endoribonuclease Cas6